MNNNLFYKPLRKLFRSSLVTEYIEEGRRSSTFLIKNKTPRLIIQFYTGEQRYQAYKKFMIYKLVLMNSTIPVPITIDVGDIDNLSYLITQELPGKPLTTFKKCQNFPRLNIMNKIGYFLSELHTKIDYSDSYGWINGEKIVKPHMNLIDYLNSEIDRFYFSLSAKLDKNETRKIMKMARKAIETISVFKHKPVFVWYDLWPNNILINKNKHYEVSGWLDPGAARIGVAEWDLAHAKLHLCNNHNDFKAILDGYSGRAELVLIDTFGTLIMIDDLVLALTESWEDLFNKTLHLLLKRGIDRS